jgi:PmbA protein
MSSPEQLLDLARAAGAEAAEVFSSQSHARPVYFEANRLKQIESTQADGIALRLWKNGRPGLAVAYGAVEPQALVAKALALSELNDPEEIELTPNRTTAYPDLGQAVPVEQLIAWGKTATELIRQRYPDVLCSGGWDCEVEGTRLLNSLGLDCDYRDTTLSGYLEVEWVRGDDFLMVGDGLTDRHPLDPATLAQHILDRLDWAQDNSPPPASKSPVLFTAKAADMLWGTVQSALNGKQVWEGASPWGDRLDQPILSNQLTLSQAPDAGPFSCPFDDEGTPTQAVTFIETGVLRGFYADRTIGRALKTGTTGNGFRSGLGSYPTPGLFNLLIAPGQSSLAELIAGIDDGLLLDQILGGGAGISGEFSINVDLGYRIKQGKIVGRVKDTMVSGNVYTALKQVMALGSDADWNGSCRTPSVLVDGLSVTGRMAQ